MSEETDLNRIREKIDAIDKQLLALLSDRARCAEEVARVKAASGDGDPVYYRPEREAQIMARLREQNAGPLSDEVIERLFREIISSCLLLEQPLTIAYLGPTGTYTEAAAIKQFGHFAKMRPMASIDEVFHEVESGAAHYGVVPVENSTDGLVKHTADCFMLSNLNICAEVELPIHQAFLVARGREDDEVALVFSHEQSLAQCRAWLNTHYPNVEQQAVASNAEAARRVNETPGAAAIAGEVAAEKYQLVVKHTNIEDNADNKTRFLVIGQQDVGPSGRDKTSILVSTRNEPGALYNILEPFHRHGISLSRLETRPSKTSTWNYVFFIDFDGHQSSETVAAVLDEVRGVTTEVKSLGSYPRAIQ